MVVLLLLLLLLRQKASPNDNHLRLSNATLGRATQRCNILCVCGCMQGGGGGNAKSSIVTRFFVFARWPPTMAYECITKSTHNLVVSCTSLSHTHAHYCISLSLTLLSLPLSFYLVTNVLNDVFLRPWQLLQLQLALLRFLLI